MNKLITTGVVVGSLILTTNLLAEGKADLGKELYANSQCMSCHSTDIYTNEDRKINDLAALENKVRLCDSQLSVNWFDDEIKDVVAYLNKAFYKFEEK